MTPDFDDNQDGLTLSPAFDTIPKGLMPGMPEIESLRRRFDEARDLTLTSREDPKTGSQTCRDYFDGPKQLNSEVRRILETRRQPPIYTNRVRPAVNGILGVLEMARSDPKGLPRNPDDEQAAPIGTKTLRYIADTSNFAEVRQEVAENFFIEGTGAVIIELTDDGKVTATQIRWEEFFYDPYARRNDLKDVRYNGVAKWIDVEAIREKYRDRINEIGDPFVSGAMFSWLGGSTWDDRPEGRGWVDRRRKRVLLVEEYHLKDGKWYRCVYIATGVLEYGLSPWLDDKGVPCNPIEAVSCYVDRDNARYGIVRDMIPIQDEINASRSRSLHLMNSRQVQRVNENAPPIDADTARDEAAKADGIIPAGYQIVPTGEQTNANLLRMQEAKGEIERMSPTPLARDLGNGSAVSGRARLVAQQAGQAEIARPLARLKDWRLRVYRQFWNRAKQFWQEPMWIRVTDQIGTPEFLQINEPVMGMVMQQMQAPDGPVITVPSIGIVGMKNRPADIGMDIILDEDPDTATLQEEVFAELMELIKSGVPMFSPEFEVMVEMSPLSDKARVLERLRKFKEEQQQAAGQAQEQQAQLMQATMAKQLEKTDAETEKLRAQTEEIGVNMLVKGFDTGLNSVPEPRTEAPAA